jgi:hypothetical protein
MWFSCRHYDALFLSVKVYFGVRQLAAAFEGASKLAHSKGITYNRRRSLRSYDSANDAVPEVLGAKSCWEQFLQLLRVSHQLAFPNAYG